MKVVITIDEATADRLKVNLLNFKLNHEDALASNDFEKQDKESHKKQVQFTEDILKAINSGTVDLPISVTSPEDSKQLSQNLAQLILTCIGEL